MKKFLKYTGVCALILAVVAFILQMATNAIVIGNGSLQAVKKGTVAIFGETQSTILGDAVTKPSILALFAWILLLVAILIVLLGVLLPIFKVKALKNVAGILNLVAVVCFIIAGVFMFCVVPTFYSANGYDSVPNNAAIGAGWVIAGILSILAGVVAVLPAVGDFIDKK